MIKKFTKKDVTEMLCESNAIEGVYGPDSLEDAQKAWDYIIKCKKLEVKDVLKVHALLMKNKKLLSKHVGAFRDCPVWIGGREGLQWTHIPDQINEWILNMNSTPATKNTLAQKSRFSVSLHVDFEKIHPWVDGNGRTGRIFMNWWRWKNGLPIWIIHEGDEQMLYYQIFK